MNYVEEGERVTNEFLNLISNQSIEWKKIKDSDGVVIYSTKLPNTKGTIYKSEVYLDAKPEQLLNFVHPTKPLRLQWDKFLETLIVVEEIISPNVLLVYHTVKSSLRGIVSARDSLDVITIGETDLAFYVSAGSVEHPNYLPTSKYVRVQQFPSGYYIEKQCDKDNRTKFVMIFNADLKMNSIVNYLAEQVKPLLMVEKINYLRVGLTELCKSSDV